MKSVVSIDSWCVFHQQVSALPYEITAAVVTVMDLTLQTTALNNLVSLFNNNILL